MNYPKELRYARTHGWVKMEGDTVVVSLSDCAQNELGDLVSVNLPEVGDQVDAGETFGDVESIKAVSDSSSLIIGTVTEVNEGLLDAPELINPDPYGTRLIKAESVETELDPLDVDAYEALTNKEN